MKKKELLMHFEQTQNTSLSELDLMSLLDHLETENDELRKQSEEHVEQVQSAWGLFDSILWINKGDKDYYSLFDVKFPGQPFKISKSVLDLLGKDLKFCSNEEKFCYGHRCDLIILEFSLFRKDKSTELHFSSDIRKSDRQRIIKNIFS